MQAYCSEASLFRALMVWTHAGADCVATQAGNKPALPLTAVADVELLLPHIRFPQMTQEELLVRSCSCMTFSSWSSCPPFALPAIRFSAIRHGCVLLLVVNAQGQLAGWHLLAGQADAARHTEVAPGHQASLPLRDPGGQPLAAKLSSKPPLGASEGQHLAGQLHTTLQRECLAVQEVACHPLVQQSAVLAELVAEAKASRDEVENLSPNSQVRALPCTCKACLWLQLLHFQPTGLGCSPQLCQAGPPAGACCPACAACVLPVAAACTSQALLLSCCGT